MKQKNEKTIATLVTLFFVISVILFIISLTFILFVQDFKTLEIRLTVGSHLGFNVDTDKLYLGTVPRGNTALRQVMIENNEYEKSIIRIKILGELKDWVTVSENNFVLKKGESKNVEIEAIVPENAERKDYDSRLVIIFTRF